MVSFLSDSSTSTPTIPNISENLISKSLIAATIKLNCSNYLLWVQSFRVFVDAQRKIKYLLESLCKHLLN